jgi:DNA polymerase (family 10)
MRWQWIEYALSKNVLLSIDPDAHSIGEFQNIRYGVLVAQKGMVTAKNNLSSFSLKEFENYLTMIK